MKFLMNRKFSATLLIIILGSFSESSSVTDFLRSAISFEFRSVETKRLVGHRLSSKDNKCKPPQLKKLEIQTLDCSYWPLIKCDKILCLAALVNTIYH